MLKPAHERCGVLAALRLFVEPSGDRRGDRSRQDTLRFGRHAQAGLLRQDARHVVPRRDCVRRRILQCLIGRGDLWLAQDIGGWISEQSLVAVFQHSRKAGDVGSLDAVVLRRRGCYLSRGKDVAHLVGRGERQRRPVGSIGAGFRDLTLGCGRRLWREVLPQLVRREGAQRVRIVAVAQERKIVLQAVAVVGSGANHGGIGLPGEFQANVRRDIGESGINSATPPQRGHELLAV